MDLGTKKRTVVESWVLAFNSDLRSSLETWEEERRTMGGPLVCQPVSFSLLLCLPAWVPSQPVEGLPARQRALLLEGPRRFLSGRWVRLGGDRVGSRCLVLQASSPWPPSEAWASPPVPRSTGGMTGLISLKLHGVPRTLVAH